MIHWLRTDPFIEKSVLQKENLNRRMIWVMMTQAIMQYRIVNV